MKIKVPKGMLKAAVLAVQDCEFDRYRVFLEAALGWLAENPIVPTREQLLGIDQETGPQPLCDQIDRVQIWIAKWQHRMFREPEPEVPEAIKDLLDPLDRENRFLTNQHIIEAYHRGQQEKEKANAE